MDKKKDIEGILNIRREIIDKNGEVRLGRVEDQQIDFNYKDYKLLNFFDKNIKGIKKRFKFHHFNYYGILSERYVLSFAVVDLGYIKNTFFYLYDYKKEEFLIQKDIKISPFSKKLVFPIDPDKYEIRFRSRRDFFTIKKDIFAKTISTKFSIDNLIFEFIAKYSYKNNFPLKIVVPAGHNGWSFTEKCSTINEFEKLDVKFNNQKLEFENPSLIYDWSGGYLKRSTNWVWANFSGLNNENKLIGANFATMVNETYETENIYWIEKESYDEDIIRIEYDKSNNYNPWSLTNKNKTISVTFYPKDEINDNTNLIFVKNSFKQFIGKFSGYFLDKSGNKVEFENISGVTEIHKALW